MLRYVHTNIITKDANKLISFCKGVFHYKSVNGTRDPYGEWIDRLTGLHQARITREHLPLPGYGEDHPALEIFSYDALKEAIPAEINHPGLTYPAFEADNVEETLVKVIGRGGSRVEELVTTEYPNDLGTVFVYAKDPEGNIVELRSWRQRKETVSK